MQRTKKRLNALNKHNNRSNTPGKQSFKELKLYSLETKVNFRVSGVPISYALKGQSRQTQSCK